MPALGVTPSYFRKENQQQNYVSLGGKRILTTRLAVLVQYRSVTDGQTDGTAEYYGCIREWMNAVAW